MKKTAGLVGLLLVFGLTTGCAQQSYQSDFFAMDTFMSISAYGDGAKERVVEAERAINALENHISRTRTQSDIYRLNAAQGEVVTIEEDTYVLLSAALEMAEETAGSFDPTVAALSDLWQIGTEEAHVPTDEEVAAALATVGYENLVLSDPSVQPRTAQLKNGAKIDLGGIGKGYAADIAAALWEDAPENAGALLRLAGNIYGVGKSERGESWVIGVANPDDSQQVIATVAIEDESIVTTGDYERYFEENGVRYHHVFDPETGYPADTDLRSVTIVGQESTRCDALSTALFVMGEEAGWTYAQQNDIKAVFVTKDHRVRVSDALADQFTFTGEDAGYVFEP